MVAFDFAKLEVEIWIHHLTPSLVNLAALWPQDGEDKPHYRLLDLALRAVEFEGNSAEFFTAQLAKPVPTLGRFTGTLTCKIFCLAANRNKWGG